MTTQQNMDMANLSLQNMFSQQPLNGINGDYANNAGHNGISGSCGNLNQSTILMPNRIMTTANKNLFKHPQSIYSPYLPQQPQQQQQPPPPTPMSHPSQQQHQFSSPHQLLPPQHQILATGAQQQQQQQQSIQHIGNQQQQVPLTNIMIPASTASQLQSVAMQIQQTALQSSPNLLTTPQIMVFMIPYVSPTTSERNDSGSAHTPDTSTTASNNGSSSVLSASMSRANFLKRSSAQRSKSLCMGNWDNVIFDIGNFRMQTYDRIVFKHPGFCRPVVIFGPLSDLAREKLLKDYPERYSYPSGISQTPEHPKVIRLKGILDIIDQGKHALLDITAQAVERLNYANLAPIVIFMKTDSKSIIKEFRSRAAKSIDPNARDEDTLRRDGKSSRKLLEQSAKLEKQWFHVFTAVLDLSTMGSEMWYRKLRETIENQQSSNVWMGERQ